MNYNELVAYYQVKLLGEKDYRGYNPDNFDRKHQNITTTKDKNQFRPYNKVSQTLTTSADQMLKNIDKSAPGSIMKVTAPIAQEIMTFYNVRPTENEPEKRLNSANGLMLILINDAYALKKE